ncbi:hypothetical protein D187_003329 [Cystobacter fuscus DSM 2262]|uniref:Uncharacterized protein n=1 Tax=Cystobacter fuscus (strain ATCC 25194 / DSM 2262 / NBRC 100088 / M29) TaxID=1242864 RepID=S9P9J5_CYSF2|nr:hypothetical protein D187_003329 [Cystobacter fuscus DSM 2262]
MPGAPRAPRGHDANMTSDVPPTFHPERRGTTSQVPFSVRTSPSFS